MFFKSTKSFLFTSLAEYWEFYTQLCINKKDTSVIVVATKSDLRNEQNEKCIPKDGFKSTHSTFPLFFST